MKFSTTTSAVLALCAAATAAHAAAIVPVDSRERSVSGGDAAKRILLEAAEGGLAATAPVGAIDKRVRMAFGRLRGNVAPATEGEENVSETAKEAEGAANAVAAAAQSGFGFSNGVLGGAMYGAVDEGVRAAMRSKNDYVNVDTSAENEVPATAYIINAILHGIGRALGTGVSAKYIAGNGDLLTTAQAAALPNIAVGLVEKGLRYADGHVQISEDTE